MEPADERFMSQVLELAREAPFSSPNPKVAALLVRDGRILARALHTGPGSPHAETLALQGVDATGATLYVNLEPCNHFGRTPPCAPAIARAAVRRVVVAMEDPDERTRGDGVAYLRAAGVEVDVGVLEADARTLNEAYVHQRTTGRPLVRLKLALSLDGKLAAPDGTSRWITGEAARARVHARRATVEAVMIGAGTAIADDPALTARIGAPTRQPARVVVDATGRIPADLALFHGGETIVATTSAAPYETQLAWKEAGAEVLVVSADRGRVDLGELVDALGRRRFLEVLCEGGAELATSLLEGDLVDRLEIHYGAVLVGEGGRGIGPLGVETMAAARRLTLSSVERAGDDVIVELERRGV